MVDFKVKLKLLLDIVNKKNIDLKHLYNITENQKDILESGDLSNEAKSLFMQMSKEKERYIENVIENDNLFQKIFSSIEDIFENNAGNYKNIINKLQEAIKSTSELDLKIRACEQYNKKILEDRMKFVTMNKSFIRKNILNKASQNYILEKYQRNNKRK